MSEKTYTWFLRLYPKRFREAYGQEAMQLFRDRLRSERGIAARLRLWLDLAFDAAFSVPREHWRPRPAMAVSVPEKCPDGIPAFYTLEAGSPRPGALIQGGILSLAIFGAMAFAISHAGTHRTWRGAYSYSGPATLARFFGSGRSIGSGDGDMVMVIGATGQSGGAGSASNDDWKPRGLWVHILRLFQGNAASALMPQLPKTPAAKLYRELMYARNSGDAEQLNRFYREHFAGEHSSGSDAAKWAGAIHDSGALDGNTARVQGMGPNRLTVEARDRSGNRVRTEIEVAPDAPNRISRFQEETFGLNNPPPANPSPAATTAETLSSSAAPVGGPPISREAPEAAAPSKESPWEKPFPVSPAILQSYAGRYRFTGPGSASIRVVCKDGQLLWRAASKTPIPVFPQSEAKFLAKPPEGLSIEFHKDSKGKVTGLTANLSGIQKDARRIRTRPPQKKTPRSL
jgi:hypothetical protein